MESDPQLVVPPLTWKLPDGLIPLWREGLARPDAEYQLRLSESIARAHREGFSGMDALTPDLTRILSAESTHPAARFAAARALIELDARDSSETLWNVAQAQGNEFRSLIEPVLADWNHEPAQHVWVERLMNANTRRRDLILSAECAATVRDSAASPRLLELALSRQRPPDIRLAAARAAGDIADAELEDSAGTLASAGSIVDRLCAVALLTRHSTPEAQQQLLTLAVDPEPSIAADALALLLSIDPQLVLPLVSRLLENNDATVRLRGAQALIALPAPERVAALSGLLDDPHTDVRVTVRDALVAHAAQSELNRPVRDSAMQVLDGERWRGQEQATLLLATLDHKPAAARMIELLESERPEVMITAAWGLRRLAVPETAPALLDKADRQTTVRLTRAGNLQALDAQVAHLFEALGILSYRPAETLLRRYVPKNYDYGEFSRGAAIFALGRLYAGAADDELAAQLMARATDMNPLAPEHAIVQDMSIIAIGRMQAASQLSALREMIGPVIDQNLREYQLGWAIEQITGEKVPPATPVERIRVGWFLQPLDE